MVKGQMDEKEQRLFELTSGVDKLSPGQIPRTFDFLHCFLSRRTGR